MTPDDHYFQRFLEAKRRQAQSALEAEMLQRLGVMTTPAPKVRRDTPEPLVSKPVADYLREWFNR